MSQPPTPEERAAAERRRAAREQAFLEIRQWGDPVLRSQTPPVTSFDAALAALADQMLRLMVAADGAGLAAPQIGALQRLFVYRPGDEGPARVVVNPRIAPQGEEIVTGLEGCLSLGKASVAVEVERAHAVVLEGQDVTGAPIRIEAEGLHARVLQHETDHLDGVLMLQRTSPEQRREATRALREGRPWRPEPPAVPDAEGAVPELDA